MGTGCIHYARRRCSRHVDRATARRHHACSGRNEMHKLEHRMTLRLGTVIAAGVAFEKILVSGGRIDHQHLGRAATGFLLRHRGPRASGSAAFYRTTWRLSIVGGNVTLAPGYWIRATVAIDTPGGTLYVPFRLETPRPRRWMQARGAAVSTGRGSLARAGFRYAISSACMMRCGSPCASRSAKSVLPRHSTGVPRTSAMRSANLPKRREGPVVPWAMSSSPLKSDLRSRGWLLGFTNRAP